MSSREEILKALQGVQMPAKAYPGTFTSQVHGEDTLADFLHSMQVVSTTVLQVQDASEAQPLLDEHFPKLQRVRLEKLSDGLSLAHVDVLEITGDFGVAENGAIWLDDAILPHRVAPFICQHLVIYLSKKNLLPTMQEAYIRLGNQLTGFGVFLSGPSKTADIEQSLVIGAHGARSLVVVLTES
ncbi:LutC/YkgG family protein [Aquirufa rosea]|uniref:LUD domain-containing protein n=1 Tax=Aquirufa rosea TaxID=2509241 RepID=A0A4Q1C0P3_9BACT|nr:LUD domain-containing protein [Aquirufa rosea]RXK49917.1 hypothetical protein ESB04_07020 [Aquirufa rosea]